MFTDKTEIKKTCMDLFWIKSDRLFVKVCITGKACISFILILASCPDYDVVGTAVHILGTRSMLMSDLDHRS